VRTVSGWINERNLAKVAEYVAALVHYPWDDLDAGALEAGIPSTDAIWFGYPIAGTPPLTFQISSHDGDGILTIRISGEIDEVLAARFDTLLDLN
jgi:hypothetical protein